MNVFLPVLNTKLTLVKLAPRLGLVAGISVLIAACATDPATPASASTAAGGTVAQSGNKICRHEKLSGTNIPKSICFTAEEWTALDKKQQGDAYDYTNKVFEGAAVSNAKNCGSSGQVQSC